jgi:hypothetical protein
MKKVKRNNNLIKAITSLIIISIIIFAISYSFVTNTLLVGLIFVIMGGLSSIVLWSFGIEMRAVYPDILFGAIDNGVLIFAAVFGGKIAGIPGAVIGGAAGNTFTDGIGGLFEGHLAENQRKYKIDNLRTALSTSMGKMIGCLFGAGAGLIIVGVVSLF